MSRPTLGDNRAANAGDEQADDKATAYRYHLLRAATERFQSSLAALDDAQRAAVHQQADQTFRLEELVLGSPEATKVVIAAGTVELSFTEVARRFASSDELDADLARNGLDAAGLRQALRRELAFDAVLQRVGSRLAEVTDTDASLFYELHGERFRIPEHRTARHILITVNDDYAENTRGAARARADEITAKLCSEPGGGKDSLVRRFARLARRHSECPTALADGKLGKIVRGQLYPEVEAVLFALPRGAAGAPVESEIGFHILLCEHIEPARILPFAQVKDRIRQALEKRRRREAQHAWIAALRERRTAVA